MVVHGLDGLDEVSTVGKTVVAHLKDGNISKSEFAPRDFGLAQAEISELQCSSAEKSAQTIFKILTGKTNGTAKADIVLVNAAAGIIVGGKACNFTEGIELAKKSITSGVAYAKLKELVKASGGSLAKLEELERNE
jgi:anthranilate phosphoribosyltransferase